jgi:23S rRNA pseudouridine1911/1915/1917 synthase
VIVREDGKPAMTEVTRLDQSRGAARGLTLVCCRLRTGRMHQIRAHLQADGLPLIGDASYGNCGIAVRDSALQTRLHAFPRQALHAWRLSFVHPMTGHRWTLEAPLPADLAELLAEAGLRWDR